MKALVLLGLLSGLVPLTGTAQPSRPDSLVQYQQVVPVAGASADDLYARAREWVALTFEDVHQVVQLDDPQRHLLLGSGYTRVQQRRPNGKPTTGEAIWFRFRLETRAGRYRLEMTDLRTVEGFKGGQFAAQDIGFWLASGHATRLASSRHSAFGLQPADLATKPGTAGQVTTILDQTMQQLFTSLQQIVTASPATW